MKMKVLVHYKRHLIIVCLKLVYKQVKGLSIYYTILLSLNVFTEN
jgi:hypothetical protein